MFFPQLKLWESILYKFYSLNILKNKRNGSKNICFALLGPMACTTTTLVEVNHYSETANTHRASFKKIFCNLKTHTPYKGTNAVCPFCFYLLEYRLSCLNITKYAKEK